MVSDSLSAPEGVPRTLVQHHKAMIGFLFGFFLVVGLYTTVSGQFGSTNTIAAVLQFAPTAEHSEQNATTSSPGAPSPPASSAPKNSTQGALHDVDNGQNVDATKKTGDQDNVHGSDSINNKTSGNFTANLDNNLQANRTDKSGQTVNNASDKQEEEIIRQELDLDGDTNERNTQHGAPRKPICDLSDPRYDVCDMSGDARAVGGANRTVLYISGGDAKEGHEWAIKDQSRKHLEYINTVPVKSLSATQAAEAPECTTRQDVPAIVFAMNGLTSNPWHDFSDVLIPLFITSRGFDGHVRFLVTDIQPWFVDKYRLILRNLSRHGIVDFDKDPGVRCHPRVVVGLRSHRDLGIDPARFPSGTNNYYYTMLDFRLYIRDIFSLPPASVDIPYKEKQSAAAAAAAEKQRKKPRLMLINRGRNRKFVNVPEISAAAEAAGFETVVVEPRRDMRLEEFSRVVDSCDVLMGAHGAGLTNFFFLRTGAVLLQVVPWGHMEHPSMAFYGVPAQEMSLRDVEYSITAEESTLYDKYGKDHPAVRDPESIHRQGWQLGMRYYWLEQDIRLNVTRFAPTLHRVLRTIRG